MNCSYSLTILLVQMTLILLFVSPESSVSLWRIIMRKWMHHRSRAQSKKQVKLEEKLKRYWEIDMKKFK